MKKFTNLFSLSKTLRFELIPEDSTKSNFDNWIKEIEDNSSSSEDNLFFKDKNIAHAYSILKRVLDKLHSEFIERSLSSQVALDINFRKYFNEYSERNVSENTTKDLRKQIGSTYVVGGAYFSEKIKSLKNQKKSNKKSKETASKTQQDKDPYKCLTDVKILKYIEANASTLCNEQISKDEILKSVKDITGFYSYFKNYNTNRANYYEYKTEKATAIATRIVNDNLPKFCDNVIRFEKNKEDYLSIYSWLKSKNIETLIKDSDGNSIEVQNIDCAKFDISEYNKCLTQTGIDEYNKLINNYNLLINLYNQSLKQHEGKTNKLNEFSPLHKQIGSEKSSSKYISLIADFEKDIPDSLKLNKNEIYSVEELLKTTYSTGKKYFELGQNNIITIPSFMSFLKNCKDWRGIYWSKNAVTTVSSLYFSNWHYVLDKLKDYNNCASFNKNREEQIELNEAIELSGLFEILDSEAPQFMFKQSVIEKENPIFDYSLSTSTNLINLICAEIEENINYFLTKSENILSLQKFREENHLEDNNTIKQIKDWFDALKSIMHKIQFFSVRKNKIKGSTPNHYVDCALNDILFNADADWNRWYDLIRNYLTKKPQEDTKEKKLKLNFGAPEFLQGWSEGQESKKRGVILKYDNDYYVCILKKTSIFNISKANSIYVNNSNAYRLILRSISFQTISGQGFVSKYGIKYSEMGEKAPMKAVECLQQFIAEKYIEKYPKLEAITTKKFKSKKEFDDKLKTLLAESYFCQFTPIDWNKVNEYEQKGELFLFKISSKDFKEKSSGKKDLQTIYWEDILSGDSSHRLCGGAEIFMREAIGGVPYKHNKDEYFVNKKDVNGNSIPDKIYKEIFHYVNNSNKDNCKLSDKARIYISDGLAIVKKVNFDIIKDKRFYERKYFFHCPVELNYKAPDFTTTQIINETIQKNNKIRFIGIDRGEKHLVYSCIIDSDCNIIECHHHDVINGTNYVEKLEDKANSRIIAKKNWQQQDSIKKLKSGYISQVVHQIVSKAIKDDEGTINPNSYIVLEDLNARMMQNRHQKFEKSTYKDLETALAKKLNFVVDKDIQTGIGSVSNALQLAPAVNNYDEIKGVKQHGIMLYTRANYTSITDPSTGWRKTIYIRNGSENDIKNQIMSAFTDFGFDGTDYYFDYIEPTANKRWRLYSGNYGKEFDRFRNKIEKKTDYNIWVAEERKYLYILDELFAKFDKTKSFKKQIEKGIPLSKTDSINGVWQSLRYVIDLIQQIRNDGINSNDKNYLLSPVRDKKGVHFDTRNTNNQGNLKFIVDADANGAYNIAHKGLIMDAHIKYWIKLGMSKNTLNLYISDEEWDLWLLNKSEWKRQLPNFATNTKKSKK